MNAFLEASSLYHGNELKNIMAYCARYGGVYADGDCFICGYRTHHSLIETKSHQAIEIKSKKTVDIPDTWVVVIASGTFDNVFEMFEPLEYVAYQRFDGSYRIVEWRKIWAVFYRKNKSRHPFRQKLKGRM